MPCMINIGYPRFRLAYKNI